jgi:hypothetical protein
MLARFHRTILRNLSGVRCLATDINAPATTSVQKIATDKRYKKTADVPENILANMHKNVVHSPGFSIKGESLPGRPAYLDFQATTPMDLRVLDEMLPYMMEKYGNPHSKTHAFGWEAEEAIENARTRIGEMIGANAKEIIFTSGATESNNIAIKGVARFYKSQRNHIITVQTEHKCVLDSCRSLESEGFEVTYLPVQPNGLIDLEQLKKAMRPTTVLVSVMGVNNEIGVIQPLKQISEVLSSLLLGYVCFCDVANYTLHSFRSAAAIKRFCILTSLKWLEKWMSMSMIWESI